MKLRALYSNDDAVFPRIEFFDGFNVVFARVRDPSRLDVDSHNLGKTFLAAVINFGLLAHTDADHPFKRYPNRFRTFVFYLEIVTNDGKFVTIRRSVSGRNAISLFVADGAQSDLTSLPLEMWSHGRMSVENARVILDRLLALDVAKPYDFRKVIGYFLRKQTDYYDTFRIAKFARGKDRDWKPLMARLLGFNHEVIVRKYDADARIQELDSSRAAFEREARVKSGEYDELRGLIEIRESAVDRLRAQVAAFSFHDLEAEVSSDAVARVEKRISDLNERRYVIDFELDEIKRSLASELEFDLSRARKLFGEVQVTFPAELTRSYEELVEFNRRMTAARSERLRQRDTELARERAHIETALAELDVERQNYIRLLQSTSTLEKYTLAQRSMINAEAELAGLRTRLQLLDRAAALEGERADAQKDREEAVAALRRQIRGENALFARIRRTFAAFVEEVLTVPALLSVEINDAGNLEFNVRTLDRMESDRETNEGAGSSYQKILCACFDLALLHVYADRSFIRFAYHDGIFEGLDNRKKVNLLRLIRRICVEAGLQHILTVIDTDLPRDERDQKLMFDWNEVARELHDGGDAGRLFRMAPF